MLLAIDTSTELTGLACYDEAGLIGECTWVSGRNHTAHVLPQLDMLMAHTRRSAADVQAVAVALGPGSWSGLRVGLSIAKGLTLAGGLALIGVVTLDALAYQHQQPAMPVFPVIRLGRERFATARYEYADDWQRVSEYSNVSLDELCAGLDARAVVCGDLDARMQAHIWDELGEGVSFPAPAANLRRPGYLAELAWQRWRAGATDQLASLEPLYLGEPVQPKTG
jgi:tRNA threonylcarbamoyladenosine biosynthesis protein TsaB